MAFNSIDFLFFGAIFYLLWPLLRTRENLRWLWLVAASFVFYGWWDWRFLLLIIASGLLDFACGLGIERWPRAKAWLLAASLGGNLGSLIVFKYFDFLIENVNAILGFTGAESRLPLASLILPVGISFYTFQSLSYTIDVYRGQLKPTRNVLHFFAYLAMFPQLVAGPIVRAADLLPQLRKRGAATEEQRWAGTRLIVLGFFKKMVVADTLAMSVNDAFALGNSETSAVYWWVAAAMFAVQIYCDFSGYSDIARGLANWMGYDFPLNFNHPYAALGMRDFWGRWHISLSTWFRDYVYVPLGGSRQGGVRSHANLWITMIISGVWHGASWTFVAWGAAHSLFLSVERVTQWPKRLMALPGGRAMTMLITFALTLVAWVLFRAETFPQAGAILTAMFTGDIRIASALAFSPKALGLTALILAWEASTRASLPQWSAGLKPALAPAQPLGFALLIVACVFLRGPGAEFVYFQF